MHVEPMTGIEPAYSAWEAVSTGERVFALVQVGSLGTHQKIAPTSTDRSAKGRLRFPPVSHRFAAVCPSRRYSGGTDG